MKIWIGKVIVAHVWQRYQQYEKDYVIEYLANVETEWLERSLPSPNHPSEVLEDDEDEHDEEELDEQYGSYEDDTDLADDSDKTDA